MPALLETAVRFLMWGRWEWIVFIRVLGTPQRPKPPARMVEWEVRGARAERALGWILLIERRCVVVANDLEKSFCGLVSCVCDLGGWMKEGGNTCLVECERCARCRMMPPPLESFIAMIAAPGEVETPEYLGYGIHDPKVVVAMSFTYHGLSINRRVQGRLH